MEPGLKMTEPQKPMKSLQMEDSSSQHDGDKNSKYDSLCRGITNISIKVTIFLENIFYRYGGLDL